MLYAMVITPMAGGNRIAAVAGTVLETIYSTSVMTIVPSMDAYTAVLLAFLSYSP